MGRGERLDRPFEPERPFVEEHLRERGPRAGGRRVGRGLERHLARHVAALTVLVVGAVADLVLGDAREPGHQRGTRVAFELAQVLERLEQRGLQHVARLEPRAQAGPEAQADEASRRGPTRA